MEVTVVCIIPHCGVLLSQKKSSLPKQGSGLNWEGISTNFISYCLLNLVQLFLNHPELFSEILAKSRYCLNSLASLPGVPWVSGIWWSLSLWRCCVGCRTSWSSCCPRGSWCGSGDCRNHRWWWTCWWLRLIRLNKKVTVRETLG